MFSTLERIVPYKVHNLTPKQGQQRKDDPVIMGCLSYKVETCGDMKRFVSVKWKGRPWRR